MLEVKKKELDSSMFGFQSQKMDVFLGTSPSLEAGYVGLVSTSLLNEKFTGEMGVPLSKGEACVGVVIDSPALLIDGKNVETLAAAGLNLTGAYNACSFSAYAELADKIGQALFKGHVEPTLKLHFGNTGEKGLPPEQRPVTKVEMIMKGAPNSHPIWMFDRL